MSIETTIKSRVDLNAGVQKTALRMLFAAGDGDAHKIEVSVTRGGAPVDLAGASVTGSFVRARDNATILLTGSVSGNSALISMVSACYNADGAFAVAVRLILSGQKHTIFYGTGSIVSTSTDTIVDNENIVPSLDDLLAQIDRMESGTQAATTAAASANSAASAANSAAQKASTNAAAAESAATRANNAAQAAEDVVAGNFPFSDETPKANGTATPGTSTLAARGDHVHPMPSASNVGALPIVDGAGAHNAIYRGKNLGTVVTDEQFAAIKAGTFDDMYIGDYWVINGTTYRIAAFDYYYRTGNTFSNTYHVTLVPDANMYTHVMNDTNITTGAYVGSKMYTEGLNQAKETINTAFGAAHILNHRQYLQNAVTDNCASGGSWYDSTVELMTEQNVYGCKIFGNMLNGTALPNNHTVDKSQYPLFAFRPDMISNRMSYWLRDVVSAAGFAHVLINGIAAYGSASTALGVRPAFSIIG